MRGVSVVSVCIKAICDDNVLVLHFAMIFCLAVGYRFWFVCASVFWCFSRQKSNSWRKHSFCIGFTRATLLHESWLHTLCSLLRCTAGSYPSITFFYFFYFWYSFVAVWWWLSIFFIIYFWPSCYSFSGILWYVQEHRISRLVVLHWISEDSKDLLEVLVWKWLGCYSIVIRQRQKNTQSEDTGKW